MKPLCSRDFTDSAGRIAFADLPPGEYVLVAGVPGDFASSRVRCLNGAGEDIARRHETNQIAVTLQSGDQIACDWYIVPEMRGVRSQRRRRNRPQRARSPSSFAPARPG